jgi:hypothetical protein
MKGPAQFPLAGRPPVINISNTTTSDLAIASLAHRRPDIQILKA